MDDGPLKFIVPPGIGDISWIYSKLVSLGRPLGFVVPRSNHDRAVSYLGLLPGVAHAEYAPLANPAKMRGGKAQANWTLEQLTVEAARRALPIEMNTWLEAGNRIEGFLPELPTEHHYQIGIPPQDLRKAQRAIGAWGRFVCLYCANRSTVKRWGGWTAEQWGVLAGLLWREFELDGFALLGAGWDRPFADEVLALIGQPVLDLVGALPIGATLEVVRRALYLVAFPSGIPILAAVMRRPVLMFYPPHLEAMQNAWADPEMIHSGAYKAMQFCPPGHAFAWIRDGYRLGDREAAHA